MRLVFLLVFLLTTVAAMESKVEESKMTTLSSPGEKCDGSAPQETANLCCDKDTRKLRIGREQQFVKPQGWFCREIGTVCLAGQIVSPPSISAQASSSGSEVGSNIADDGTSLSTSSSEVGSNIADDGTSQFICECLPVAVSKHAYSYFQNANEMPHTCSIFGGPSDEGELDAYELYTEDSQSGSYTISDVCLDFDVDDNVVTVDDSPILVRRIAQQFWPLDVLVSCPETMEVARKQKVQDKQLKEDKEFNKKASHIKGTLLRTNEYPTEPYDKLHLICEREHSQRPENLRRHNDGPSQQQQLQPSQQQTQQRMPLQCSCRKSETQTKCTCAKSKK